MFTPVEFQFGGVLMPPLFVSAILGLIAAALTSKWLNRLRLSHYFFYPPLVLLAMAVIYTVLISTFIIPS